MTRGTSSLAALFLLVAAAVLVRAWLVPQARDLDRASDSLQATSQRAMARAHQIDLAQAADTDRGLALIDALLAGARFAREKKALQTLRTCVSSDCEFVEEQTLAVKESLAAELTRVRGLVGNKRRRTRQRESILFGLLTIGAALTFVLRLREIRTSEPSANSSTAGEEALEVTLRERLEQLYKARKRSRENARFAAFGEVAAGLSHGLKTPLACVRAATQVAQAKIEDDHSAQDNLDDVIDQVDALTDQINRFLKTMGGGEPDMEPLAPNDFLGPLDERYRQGRPDRGVTWKVRLSDEVQRVRGEAELIEMALRNLIDNALEATCDHSEVVLSVGLCSAPKRVGIDAAPPSAAASEHAWVEVAVIDEGPGVSTDLVNEEHVQSSRAGGSGLGIAIASRIAARMGGVLLIAPQKEGRGTRASFILPPVLEDSSAQREATEPDDLHH